jgi:hypothetical protein
MCDLVELWRSKTDDEVVDAMKDIGGYLPEAQKVIRAEFAERGLTYRKTYREEKKELHDRRVGETVNNVKRYLFPTEMVAVVRLIGVMCVAPLLWSYDTRIGYVRWAVEYTDGWSIALGALAIAETLWSVIAAYAAFRPSQRGWSVLVVYVALAASIPLTSILTMAFNLGTHAELLGVVEPFLGIDNSWGSLADAVVMRLFSIGLWTAALYVLYRPSTQEYMAVSEERRIIMSKVIQWLAIAVATLGMLMNIV